MQILQKYDKLCARRKVELASIKAKETIKFSNVNK